MDDKEIFKRMDEEQDENKKHLYIFGTDVAQIPCFRNSFLYGISSGIAGGLVTFLGTSRPQFSTHCGFGTFMVTTLCYWFYCSYKFSSEKFRVLQLQSLMKKQAIYEGTEVERKLLEHLEQEERK
uniref:Cytochrome c oxidase assembly protein COX20, mitochondrial n=1 Tax=Xenopsylla cheopis TaxID=163159 RepID=A0A6M2DHB3_XENCH